MGWGRPGGQKVEAGASRVQAVEKMDGGEGWSSAGASRSATYGSTFLGKKLRAELDFPRYYNHCAVVTKQFVMYLLCTEYKTDITDVVFEESVICRGKTKCT